MNKEDACNLCGSTNNFKIISEVTEKPKLETDYGIAAQQYSRKICHCLNCGVYFNSYAPELLPENFYTGFYNNSIDSGKLIERFNRITSLPIEQSDNKQRVSRIINFLSNNTSFDFEEVETLDVGTGTGVFVHELKKYINKVNCVDPDPHSIRLVKQQVQVENAWIGSVNDIPDESKFDFISFNKVLEHVENPIQLLKTSVSYLKMGGIIYIELPYSDLIISEGKEKERAEFFVEHLAIYNEPSINFLINKAGLKNLEIEVIMEASGKNTIFAFCEVS
ncbi:class I SAM-dependent methyltransferase [Marivirga arenosa]|uniref:Class I SAM-dependent methyltransferase n=1 Tax=Marivirga arenosa TaxID=3059076 RepID=A0AA51N5A6_9BACT|nr:class I SAM-dependent methyltransferase [Marivirga sp. ABR2-2]WMN06392.1 class I SAM-dependent methyltransferase [Marivirga sp. ABR2-2]